MRFAFVGAGSFPLYGKAFCPFCRLFGLANACPAQRSVGNQSPLQQMPFRLRLLRLRYFLAATKKRMKSCRKQDILSKSNLAPCFDPYSTTLA
jgi:hypothetical protein